ncbi:MAG: NAD-glutamate dehydrogenase [Xanthomonadales bacterium]|nr:NAD-glutamate dehydrogenase [Xanthomonadales bacterium]
MAQPQLETARDFNAILTCLRARPALAKELEPFLKALYERLPGDDISSRSAADWVGLAQHLHRQFRARKADQALIRVYNPSEEEHGYQCPHTVVEILTDDSPFLVDSVSMAIARHRLLIHLIVHPVLVVERDPGGYLLGFRPSGGKGRPESVMHFEVDRETEPEELDALRQSVEKALVDVRACVNDFIAMKTRMQEIVHTLPGRATPHDAALREEAAAFLAWLLDDHYTFLGSKVYESAFEEGREVVREAEGSGLGILRAGSRTARDAADLVTRSRGFGGKPEPLILTKTNARATVHHPGYMDYVGVLSFDEQGRPCREERFLGLFTSNALSCRVEEIPLIRLKVEQVMQRAGLRPDGHSGKTLMHILETLPREELFQSSVDELHTLAIGVLNLRERQRTRVFCRRDRYGRYWSALVYVPRDRMTPTVREKIEQRVRLQMQADRLDSQIQVGESALARLYIVARPRSGEAPTFDARALEAEVVALVRNWHDELREQLVGRLGEDRGAKLSNKFGRALPAAYIESATPAAAARDVETAAGLRDLGELALSLQTGKQGSLRLKLYKYGDSVALSDVLPVLENLGLRVRTEHPYRIELPLQPLSIQDFEVEVTHGAAVEVDAVHQRFEDAFLKIWRGAAESDGFNRLILAADMNLRQVTVLRAYCKYLLQTGLPYSQPYIERALQAHPVTSRVLIELFDARFDPDRLGEAGEAALARFVRNIENLLGGHVQNFREILDAIVAARQERDAQITALTRFIARLMDWVTSLDEDRILRAFENVILATLRTNAFQSVDGKPKPYLSLKFDSALVPDLPKPVPYREIFVYSPRVEGVHLRFGKVARGGLRWSDRREDFRTEVLGLVKAQQVKNTVIVPVGAKGGFYVKQRPADRDAVLAEGVACYRMFISGLLDITDNVVQGVITPPVDVVRHDGDDPYLVVAADKGTATFSDIANALSLEYGFWLGDAFASGGSKGYDHKKMGITAKGAWESVKRHFRALGRDCQTEPFSVVGIGDMSGDVFGNGMLLSTQIRLIAAFDHRHIFIDPNPDVAVSFAERERMFALPRSSWMDYDKAKISAGGGVYPRDAKALTIPAEAAQALGIGEESVTLSPQQLMKAILKAPVDLLWNGGIGTYVKAASETHEDCGDRANNAIRVNGGELRAKIIGEGGNLGCTQRGRIEYAMAGGLVNTDFIDNSAGVDTSDHEVNIKILLADAIERGELDDAARDQLLAEMTEEVGNLVIFDNYRQNHAISLMRELSLTRLGAKQHFIRTLEARGQLDRALEFLPTEEEFADRKARGLGLTRPELSVLLSYSKIELYQQLLDSDVPEDPYLSKELELYFPTPLRERFAANMQRHRLKREIIATQVTNYIVNRMGATFVLRMTEDTGEAPGEVAKAYTIAREILDARQWWAEIDRLSFRVDAVRQIQIQLTIWNVLRAFTRWLLNLPGQHLDIAASVSKYGPGLKQVLAALPDLVAEVDNREYALEAARLSQDGFSDGFATTLSRLPALTAALDIVDAADSGKWPVERVGKVYFDLGEALHLKWFRDQIEALPVEGRWHANARGALRDELNEQHRALTVLLLQRDPDSDAAQLVPQWLDRCASSMELVRGMLAEMRSQRTLDFPTASVAIRRLNQLVNAERRAQS